MIKGPILIVGAGIGGLTSAIALRRKGFEVEVIEKDRISSVCGVGIIQQSNVVRAMADEHGFGMRKQSLTSDSWADEFYAWLKANQLLAAQ